MGRFNEILVGRYNRALQKLLSMKGPPPAPQVATEIQPVIALEDDRIEFLFLAGTRYFGGTIHSGGAAAVINQFQLFNPVASGVLAVVKSVRIIADVADRFILTIDNVAQGAAQPGGTFMDTRFFKSQVFGTTTSALVQRFAQPAALTGQRIGELSTLANTFGLWNDPVVLSPGFGLNVQNLTVNQGSGVAYVWTERVLEDSEN